MGVKDCPNVFQAMPGKGGNLGIAASAKGETGDGSSAKIMESQPAHLGFGHYLAP